MSDQKTVDIQTGTTTNPNIDLGDFSTLIVVSKVKAYIRQRADLNTSQDAIDALTRKVAELANEGIERAKASGRKTVMGRDIL